jgi:nicotinate phosphoribosyltransferase
MLSIAQERPMDLAMSPLLTDLYQLNMVEAYLRGGQTKIAVFEFFVRKLPPQRSFLIAAGLDSALDFLENVRFSDDDLAWLGASGRFGSDLLNYLAGFRFTGDVHAVAEGTAFFANEPILRVTAPIAEAQLVETRLINILQFQSLIAAKAARMVLQAPGKQLVDFGLRRAHGADAGLLAARACYCVGFAGTATILANKLFDIPLFGTMAHSFVEAFDKELVAFESFARARPDNLIFLIDTYDVESAARKVVTLAPRLEAAGIKIRGVRIDSGDLIALSRTVREILDEGGLTSAIIFASGGIDEATLCACLRAGAPIDGFGIGTNLVTSSDAPALDCAYKLQEYAGLPRRKRSTGKATWPGRKQFWRCYGSDGRMSGDILSIEDDLQVGEPMVKPVMRAGRRLFAKPTLAEIRAHASRQLARLPDPLRQLEAVSTYPVEIADALVRTASQVDQRLAARSSSDG